MSRVEELSQMIQEKLVGFVGSADLEVQERASCAIQLLKYLNKLKEKGKQNRNNDQINK